jgi:hypothetical protein
LSGRIPCLRGIGAGGSGSESARTAAPRAGSFTRSSYERR